MKRLSFLRTILATIVVLGILAAPAFCGSWWLWDRGEKGSGDLVTEEREVRDFTKIKSSGSFDVYVRVGHETKVSVTFDDNLIDHIRTRVRGHTLRIDSEGSYSSRHNCRIDITVSRLSEITCSGSGSIEVEGLRTDEFAFKLSGSGEFKAEGEVRELEISVSGSGEVDTRDVIAEDAYVKVSGSGKVRVRATESLDSHVSGSGNIYYYGDPEYVSEHISGSGKIRKRK